MDLLWNPQHIQEPIESYDCNYCKWLNITEWDQERCSVELVPHYCHKYDKRIFHRTSFTDHPSILWPCLSCVKDGYKNFIVVDNPSRKIQSPL